MSEAEESKEGGKKYEQSNSPMRASRSSTHSGRPSCGELLPGVIVTIAHDGTTLREDACDGQITLGVPMGTARYVRQKVVDLVAKHNNRAKGLVMLSDAHGDEVQRRDANLAFALSLHGLRQSANARSAHFLRSLPRELVTDGIRAHDNGIKVAMAVALEQMQLPAGLLSEAEATEATESFQQGWGRMTLHTGAGGLGMRQWENYCDAAYIGCWAQAWKVTQRKIGGVTVCVMPALAQTLQVADQFRSARAVDHRYWTPQVRVSDLAKALHDAWEACVATAKQALQISGFTASWPIR
jgi:hypothetical protein